jgi:hypothetical protein
MARDGKEQVVIERRELGKGIAELLRCRLSHNHEVRIVLPEFNCQRGLQFVGDDLGWELAQPSLEHAADGVRVVKLLFGKQVHVEFCICQLGTLLVLGTYEHTLIEATLPMLDLRTTAGYTIQAFRLAVEVQVTAIC